MSVSGGIPAYPVRGMFSEFQTGPRVYTIPSGLPFARTFADGLHARLGGLPPETMARTRVFVSGVREIRPLREALQRKPDAAFLPRILSLRNVARDLVVPSGVPPSVDYPHREMALARLVDSFHSRTGNPQSGAETQRLAGDLAKLLGELHREGIEPARLGRAAPEGLADHWRRTSQFLDIIGEAWPQYLEDTTLTDPEFAHAAAVDALVSAWQRNPPVDPVLVAGSTATDAAVQRLVVAVVGLPAGAVVLAGLDQTLDEDAWDAIAGTYRLAPEHPQFHMKRLIDTLKVERKSVPAWTGDQPSQPERSRLLAQALRPAPVTEAWREQAVPFDRIAEAAMAGVELVEAANAGEEATVIALALREAAESDGVRATFVTEDAGLRRRVLAKCARWGFVPHDSRGDDLAHSETGRFALLAARVALLAPDTVSLLALLKSACCRAGARRAAHLASLSQVERILRSGTGRRPGLDGMRQAIRHWSDKHPKRAGWAEKLVAFLDEIEAALAPLVALADAENSPVLALVQAHTQVVANLAGDDLETDEREKLAELFSQLTRHASHRGAMRPGDYPGFFAEQSASVARYRTPTHQRIAIQGTLLARFDPPERVIIGGLNEDTTPGQRGSDPWLNRRMREALGLPPPERMVGALAHDFSELFAVPQLILTRAVATGEEVCVASRWLLRLTNLLEGIGAGGATALASMRDRGSARLRLARALDRPQGPPKPAVAPEPRPPAIARPRQFSATAIERLVRDPYSFYARYILRLRPLEPPGAPHDGRMRGTIAHQVMAGFLAACRELPDAASTAEARRHFDRALANAIENAFGQLHEWPWLMDLWANGLRGISPWLVTREIGEREKNWRPAGLEVSGEIELATPNALTITARADRIDSRSTDDSGVEYFVYDYKTGTPPTQADLASHVWQLKIAGLIAAHGGFPDLPPGEVAGGAYLGIAPPVGEIRGKVVEENLGDLDAIEDQLIELLSRFESEETAYPSHAAINPLPYAGEFDHLARVAEWTTPSGGESGHE